MGKTQVHVRGSNREGRQGLQALGLLYTASSTFLFEAYKYIASGLATTLVFLFPVMVAIIMVFLKVVPSWQVWLSIIATFAGVMIMTGLDGGMAWINLIGLAVLPTIVSTATLAIATRNIGATKASVLGVFEPITAILVGTLVFGEALTTNIITGIMISIVAVTFMIMVTKR